MLHKEDPGYQVAHCCLDTRYSISQLINQSINQSCVLWRIIFGDEEIHDGVVCLIDYESCVGLSPHLFIFTIMNIGFGGHLDGVKPLEHR